MSACRFAEKGCPEEAVYRCEMDRGCTCYPDDRVQLLCAQHASESEPLGSWASTPYSEKRVRAQHTRSRADSHGHHAVGLGVRIGYWPCLGGPFISFTLGSHRIDVWHGRPSYWAS